jgi:hypothetical protein
MNLNPLTFHWPTLDHDNQRTGMYPQSPRILEIGKIMGGFSKVRVNIKNVGGNTVNNISCHILLNGGYIFLGRENNGSIFSLNPGVEKTIIFKPIIGLGKTVIKIIATVNGSITSKERNANMLLFLIIIDKTNRRV